MSALGSTLDKVPTLELEQDDKISPCEFTRHFPFLVQEISMSPLTPPSVVSTTLQKMEDFSFVGA